MVKQYIFVRELIEHTAEKYAALLGISKDNICANAVGAVTKPGEVSKTSYIEKLKGKGCKVAMVGDATNDVHSYCIFRCRHCC